MSSIVVLGFKDEESAEKFKSTLDRLSDEGAFGIEDAVIVVVAQDGTPAYRHFSSVMRGGALIGGVLGGIVGLLVLSPVAGAALGAAGGSAIGKLTGDYGIEDDFIEQTSRTLVPGTAALFLQVVSVKPGAIEQAVQGEDITVITTRLGKEAREVWTAIREDQLALEEQAAAQGEATEEYTS